MCTLTVDRRSKHLVMTMNRDERRSRPEADLYSATDHGGLAYVFPVDAESGGTWFGVNAYGVGGCILNRYDETHSGKQPPVASRGTIIPRLLEQQTLEAAFRVLDGLSLQHFRNFDLVLFDNKNLLHCIHQNGVGTVKKIESDCTMFSSSSWNTQQVIDCRLQKFRDYLSRRNGNYPDDILEHFHLSKTEDDRFSVLMARPTTHTKSVSQLIVGDDDIRFSHFDQHALAIYHSEKQLEKLRLSAKTLTMDRRSLA
jgi:uncharacterized protein with NRDE domain